MVDDRRNAFLNNPSLSPYIFLKLVYNLLLNPHYIFPKIGKVYLSALALKKQLRYQPVEFLDSSSHLQFLNTKVESSVEKAIVYSPIFLVLYPIKSSLPYYYLFYMNYTNCNTVYCWFYTTTEVYKQELLKFIKIISRKWSPCFSLYYSCLCLWTLYKKAYNYVFFYLYMLKSIILFY